MGRGVKGNQCPRSSGRTRISISSVGGAKGEGGWVGNGRGYGEMVDCFNHVYIISICLVYKFINCVQNIRVFPVIRWLSIDFFFCGREGRKTK